jgi:hypothetical protein
VNETEFEAWFKKITIQEVVLSSYFDGSDYETPIHYFLDDTWFSLQYGRSIVY